MSKTILFAVVGVVAVVAIGGGAYFFLFSGSGGDAEATEGEAVEGELDATPEVTPVAVDGKLGPRTRAALNAFRSSVGLSEADDIDDTVRGKLEDAHDRMTADDDSAVEAPLGADLDEGFDPDVGAEEGRDEEDDPDESDADET